MDYVAICGTRQLKGKSGIAGMSNDQMKDLLRSANLPTEGKRVELCQRILEAKLAQASSPRKVRAGASSKRTRKSSKSPRKVTEKKHKRRQTKAKLAGIKHGRSAYLQYSNTVRPQFRARYPNESITDIARRIGQEWQSLSEAQKAPYRTAAAADRDRYQKQMAEHDQRMAVLATRQLDMARLDSPTRKGLVQETTFPYKSRGKTSRPRITKAKFAGIKRPWTAYLHFSNEQRAAFQKANPGLAITKLAGPIGEAWRSLPAAQRAKYEQLAAEDNARYRAQMVQYESNMKLLHPEAAQKEAAPKKARKTRKSATKKTTKKSPKKATSAKRGPKKVASGKRATKTTRKASPKKASGRKTKTATKTASASKRTGSAKKPAKPKAATSKALKMSSPKVARSTQ